jgi:hypothetical protein
MYIKAQTVIPAGTKITKCPPKAAAGKNVYSLLRAEEKRIEKNDALKAKANKVAACLKAGYTVIEAMKLCEE